MYVSSFILLVALLTIIIEKGAYQGLIHFSPTQFEANSLVYICRCESDEEMDEVLTRNAGRHAGVQSLLLANRLREAEGILKFLK